MAFSAEHTRTFLPALGARPGGTATYTPTVGVIDTGWDAPVAGVTIARELDLTKSPPAASAPDTYGHGSVVGAIIHDVAPDADLAIYKISDDGTAREWAYNAALLTATADGCDVVNASVGFGLKDKACRVRARSRHHPVARVPPPPPGHPHRETVPAPVVASWRSPPGASTKVRREGPHQATWSATMPETYAAANEVPRQSRPW